MPKTDPRIDAYIARAGEFARPILNRVRALVHKVCPEVAETIKWNSPFYEYQGILLATPAFKKHCALIFWKHKLIFKDLPAKVSPAKRLRRLTSLDELPDNQTLSGYLRKAVKLNAMGVKVSARSKPRTKVGRAVPGYFVAALKRNPKAAAGFNKLSPGCKREYVEWLLDAKREATRARRLAAAISWIAEGKKRNWKYENC